MKEFDGLEFGESKWLKDNLGIKVNPVISLKSLGGKLLRKDEEIVTLDLAEQRRKMTRTIEAIYQNGIFKPLNPISEELADGEMVEITIKDKKLSPDEMLKLAGQVYEGLSDEDI